MPRMCPPLKCQDSASSVSAVPQAKSGSDSAKRRVVGQAVSQRGPPASLPLAAGGKGSVPGTIVNGRSLVSFQPSLVRI